jgi:hypothetical protein
VALPSVILIIIIVTAPSLAIAEQVLVIVLVTCIINIPVTPAHILQHLVKVLPEQLILLPPGLAAQADTSRQPTAEFNQMCSD